MGTLSLTLVGADGSPQSWSDVSTPLTEITTWANTTKLSYVNVQTNGLRADNIRTHAGVEGVRVKVRNASGGTIAADSLIYFSGTYSDGSNNYPTIGKAVAASSAGSTYLAQGVTTASIANNSDGTIAMFYEADSLNTSASSAAGAPVYLSSVAGAYTFTEPTSEFTQVVGIVTVDHASTGRIIFSLGSLPQEALALTSYAKLSGAAFTGDITVFDDANNADTSISLGTSATEALVVEALNGTSNKTLEELRVTTKTASGTGDHGQMTFYVDETKIASIDDGGINLESGKSFTVNGSAISTSAGGSNTQIQYNNSGAFAGSANLVYASDALVTSSSSANLPSLEIKNTHADATAGKLIFTKDPASGQGADNDVMGTIEFFGTDGGNNAPELLSYIDSYVVEADHGSEASGLRFYVAENDATKTLGLSVVGQASDDGEVDVTIGAGAASTTTIAGTLTMGSTAALTNAGLVSVANQSGITGLGTISSGTWEATDVAVAHGGTGSSNASDARTALGLAIGSNVQAHDADLTAIAGLSNSDGNFIVGSASGWVAESGSTVRTSLGLGTMAVAATGDYSVVAGSSSIVTVGTISTGTWQGTAIASAYLDADTAHLSGTQTFTGAKTFTGSVTTGVDDTGVDVKFFGASAGAYMEWDQSADQLRIMGASADATTSTGKLLLATANPTINANDILGKIDFQAPHETGTDAVEISASIQAIAQDTFSASVNATDLIFYTGHSEAATEKFRITSQGELGVGGANYGSDGQVLTSTGAGTAPAWENASGAYSAWSVKTTTYTASSGDQLICNHASTGFTVTLPSSPSAGNTVVLKNVGNATVTIGRNSKDIDSVAADGTLLTDSAVQLVFVDDTFGWVSL